MVDLRWTHSMTLLFIILYPAVSSTRWNVARFKPANQSSIYGSICPPSLGNDGDRRNTSDRCVRTETEIPTKAWWMVDLQDYFTVTSVYIVFSADTSALPLDLAIAIYDDDAATHEIVCSAHFNYTAVSEGSEFICTNPIKGRFVKLLRTTPGFLQFCEFEVMVSDDVRQPDFIMARKNIQVYGTVSKHELQTRSLVHCAVQCRLHTEPWVCNCFNWDANLKECTLLLADPRTLNNTVQKTATNVSFYIEDFS